MRNRRTTGDNGRQVAPEEEGAATEVESLACDDPTPMLQVFRDNALLGGLADAMAEAGCTDKAILGHLRGGERGRGCHVVDALLGRESAVPEIRCPAQGELDGWHDLLGPPWLPRPMLACMQN